MTLASGVRLGAYEIVSSLGAGGMLVDQNPSDFHFLTWGADGAAIGYGFGLDTSLWRFTPRQ